MLNFRDNFFFAKFTVFFFILTIFGYWGIDLNSEELYIVFSFFLLVIAGVVLSRKSILLLFIKSVNTKFFRLLSDLLIIVSALSLRVNALKNLRVSLEVLFSVLTKFSKISVLFFSKGLPVVKSILQARVAFLSIFLSLSSSVFFKNLLRLKRFYSFSSTSSKFFSIKI